jgi:transposase-like protein
MIQLNPKRVSKELKYNILSDHFEKGTPISELARVHGIHPITIYKWRSSMGDKPEEKLDIQKIIEENNELKKREKQLLKALGDLALDNQILKDLNEFLKKRQQEQRLKMSDSLSEKTPQNTRKPGSAGS